MRRAHLLSRLSRLAAAQPVRGSSAALRFHDVPLTSLAAVRQLQRTPSALLPASARAFATAETANTPPPTQMKSMGGGHPSMRASQVAECYLLHQPVYTEEELKILPCERPQDTLRDKLAYRLVSAARFVFDRGTGYGVSAPMTEAKWLQRFIFLETVAAIPGMVGGAVRHLHSLRLMKRDNGWIHTLLEEAENERMHLLTFIQLRDPGPLFRMAVLGAQGVLFNLFFASYLLSPKTVHRFVGHLEEQAVVTYTHALRDIDEGKLPQWTNLRPPEIAMDYWKLKEGAVMKDLLLAVRADEACHSHVNHTFASLPQNAVNPFRKGQHSVPLRFVDPPPGIDMNTGLAVGAAAKQ